MKYKILLTGTNQVLLGEFFTHLDYSFECMGSTERPEDILCHLKYFHPDALVFCLNREGKQEISGLRGVVQRLSADGVPLIIVGEDDACNLFGKTLPMAADLTVRKPITTAKLEEKISDYLRQRAAEKERERKRIEKLEKEAGIETETEAREKAEKNEKELLDTLAFIDKLADEVEEKEVRKKHVLIVDDDSTVLKLVKGYLGTQYNVATAINGKVALKFLEKKETDLILLDYEMPEENGAQVLQRLRSSEKTKDLPVVFLTGMTEKERIQEVLALNPQGYLLKPINMERLSGVLKNILGE